MINTKMETQSLSNTSKRSLELWEHMFETFHPITSIVCAKLYESMLGRVQDIIYAKGIRIDFLVYFVRSCCSFGFLLSYFLLKFLMKF